MNSLLLRQTVTVFGVKEKKSPGTGRGGQGMTSSEGRYGKKVGGYQYLLKIMGLRNDLNKVVTVRKWGDINAFLKSRG